MPHLDGFAVLEGIQQLGREGLCPVLVLTSETDQDCRVRAISKGANDFLNKPFDFVEGLARVENLLSIRFMYNQITEQNKNLDKLVMERTAALQEESRSRLEAEQLNTYLARHDLRIGCPNRLLLEEKIRTLIKEKPEQGFSLIVVYLNRFLEINHTLGYQNGNQLLTQVAQRLSDITDTLPSTLSIEEQSDKFNHFAVLEGVTFAVLTQLNDPESTETEKVIEAILEAMLEPFVFQGMSLYVGAMAGAATYPLHGDAPDILLQHAHIALEVAQTHSQHKAIYSTSIDPYSERRLALMGELQTAIEKDKLKLVYQPQIDVSANCINGVEALLRWQHEEMGFIPPDEFIPLAEQTGVIRPLTQWVLQKSLQQCAGFLRQGIRLKMGINLSARNLHEDGLAEQLVTLAAELNVPSEMVVLEVTESAMMSDQDRALQVLTQLHDQGFRISIDDFGTGYSSLAYLKKLPVKEIKIDRSFVMEMIRDKSDLMIVRTTIDMAHNLGLEVVAEGVEDQETLDQLREMGCDIAQGYYMSRPVPVSDLEKWLEESPWGTGFHSH
jgi:EAL domain-containing protein (putative c-di-GMP-specific phosphodiesterase class I)/GGDEF domain-containing protein